MTVGAVLAPLVRGRTYRRAVHLLLGAVIALPYVLLGAIFVQILGDAGNPLSVTLTVLVVALVIAAIPAFLAGTRTLEIAAARSLLEADLPQDYATTETLDRETRLRSALWFALHLLTGSLVGMALLTALPMALIFIIQLFGAGTQAMRGLTFGPLDGASPLALTVTGVLMLIALIYAIAGLGALAAMMAPTLLGPSQRERIAALEVRAEQLAERNRLARELHDSVGHALTVTTLQAGAAAQLLDSDPQFVRRALQAIEDAGRAAMEDLDYVLGVLREETGGRTEPHRTLQDLDRLVADGQAAGLEVSQQVSGSIQNLPAAVSREGYRIVQEGLTNAARHARRGPVSLRVTVLPEALEIDMVNATRAGSTSTGRGRGLAGMRERVLLLGGELTAGPIGSDFQVSARIPVGRS